MDKRIAIAIAAIIVAVALFFVPDMFRTELVSTYGILFANGLRLAATICGAICLAGAVGLGWKPVHRAITNRSSKKQIVNVYEPLLPLDATNIEEIEPELLRMVGFYPATSDGVRTCLDQVKDIQKSLTSLVQTLSINPNSAAILKARYGRDADGGLLQKLLLTAHKELVGITYKTRDPAELGAFVKRVIEENSERVEDARRLTDSIFDLISEQDDDTSASAGYVKQAIRKLQGK